MINKNAQSQDVFELMKRVESVGEQLDNNDELYFIAVDRVNKEIRATNWDDEIISMKYIKHVPLDNALNWFYFISVKMKNTSSPFYVQYDPYHTSIGTYAFIAPVSFPKEYKEHIERVRANSPEIVAKNIFNEVWKELEPFIEDSLYKSMYKKAEEISKNWIQKCVNKKYVIDKEKIKEEIYEVRESYYKGSYFPLRHFDKVQEKDNIERVLRYHQDISINHIKSTLHNKIINSGKEDLAWWYGDEFPELFKADVLKILKRHVSIYEYIKQHRYINLKEIEQPGLLKSIYDAGATQDEKNVYVAMVVIDEESFIENLFKMNDRELASFKNDFNYFSRAVIKQNIEDWKSFSADFTL